MSSAKVRRVGPRARVTSSARYFHAVYAWTWVIETARGEVPLAMCIGIHRFKWTAERARKRWLKTQKALAS